MNIKKIMMRLADTDSNVGQLGMGATMENSGFMSELLGETADD